MSSKEQIDYLLLDIRELESLVASMRGEEMLPIRVLAESSNQAFKVIEKLNRLETEQIQHIGSRMAEQQEELMRLSLVFERLQHSTRKCKADIRELEEQEAATQQQVAAPATVQPPVVPPPPPPMVASAPKAEEASAAKPAAAPIAEPSNLSFNEILEKKNLSDFRKAFSLNDRFYFRRELFAGDEARMNKAITDLDNLHSYEESVAYLHNELKWNIEDSAVADFIKLLEKRFL